MHLVYVGSRSGACQEVESNRLSDLVLDGLQRLRFVKLEDALYRFKVIQVCGTVQGVSLSAGELFLQLRATGTQDDSLLIDVRVCSDARAATLTGEFMVDGRKYAEVARDGEPWYTNVEAG